MADFTSSQVCLTLLTRVCSLSNSQLADHVNAAMDAGVKASTAKKGCRYCLLDMEFIPLSRSELDPPPCSRFGDDMEKIINEAKHLRETGALGASRRLLTDYGYLEEMVLLYSLSLVSYLIYNFFKIACLVCIAFCGSVMV